MNSTNGYIYVRNHPSYDVDDACKMGKANNIPERDTQYATSEIKRGYFEAVFEVPIEKMGIVERLLQNEFRELNVKNDAGTEFYNKKIITLIEPYLIKLGIKYKKLSKEEISDLVRCNRVRKTVNKINIKNLILMLKILRQKKNSKSITPRDYQTDIIEKSLTYFQQHNKGILELICGVGKTLISLWITKELNSNTILIGVPNKLLLKQWEKETKLVFGNDIPCLVVSGCMKIETITKFLQDNGKKCIVITTYSSAHKVCVASQNTKFIFGMKILDEVHHLTTTNMRESDTTKKFIKMLNIPSVKQLALTATLKILEGNENERSEDIIVSNDNIEHFGEIIDSKCLLWAIDKRIICDYDIQTIITNEEHLESYLGKFNIIEETEKRLFLSAFVALKNISDGHSKHLLIYANNKGNTEKINSYIKMLLDDEYFNIPGLYYSNYHSEMNECEKKTHLDGFNTCKYGIISCVYCLGEGYDNSLIDGEVFAENMTSVIRILQAAMRAFRKHDADPNKRASIILPILYKDLLENSADFEKIRNIVYQMGLEDITISQKITVSIIEFGKQLPKKRANVETESVTEFGKYDAELTNLLRLKTVKRSALGTSYKKARNIIAPKKLRSREEYADLCDQDNRLSKDPETVYYGQFTNWVDYFSIERIYYDLDACKNKVGEYLLLYPVFKKHYLNLAMVCDELCKIDPVFPPNELWVEYYGVKELRDIITITIKKKGAGVSL